MQASVAITQADSLRANDIRSEVKYAWLCQIDGQIYEEIMKGREGCPDYSPENKMEHTRELLVPEPYAMDFYVHYLHSQIDLYYDEPGKFNQDALLFEAARERFREHWCSTHRIIRNKNYYRF